MRSKLAKFVAGIALSAFVLSLVPVGVQTTQAQTVQQEASNQAYSQCMSIGGANPTNCAQTAKDQTGVSPTNTSITAPVTITPGPQTVASTEPEKLKKDTSDFGCVLTGGDSFASCIAAMVYYIGPGLASNVAYIGAAFFSIVVQLSLNSTAYALDFLSEGWTIVRDLANIAFIFILIYIALTIMFQAETTGTIKTLAVVIVIALLVNFSFFFTRVMIDMGNVVALQFYNGIDASNREKGGAQETIGGVKDLSFAIMGAIKLQSLYGQKSFDDAKKSCGASGGVTCGLIVSTIIYLAVAAMFWMLFFTFLTVGIKFMLRIVGLWFVLIASPLAFVAKTIKKTEPLFEKWLKMLIQFSLYPAIFLFMFFILNKFVKSLLTVNGQPDSLFNAIYNSSTTNPNDVAAATGYVSSIAQVSIRMGFVLAVLYVGLKVSDWLVTEGGNIAKNVTNFSGKAAFGTAGFIGRWGIGPGAGLIAQSSKLAKSKNMLAQGLWRTGRFLEKRSFDVRAVPGVKGAFGMSGIDVGSATGKGGTRATREAVTGWFDKYSKEVASDRQHINEGVAKVEARQAARDLNRLGYVSQVLTQEKDLEKWDEKITQRVGPTSPAQLAAEATTRATMVAEITRAKAEAARRGGKSFDELAADHAILTNKVENFSAAQVTSLKAADIQGIIKNISEAHLKAIKESGKYAGDVVKEMAKAWHEENKKAPLAESKKQVELLGKLYDEMSAAGINIAQIKNIARPGAGNTTTVNLKMAEDAKKETEKAKKIQETIRDDTGAGRDERREARAKARDLNEAVGYLDKLIEKIKDVPDETGGEKAPAAFKYTQKL